MARPSPLSRCRRGTRSARPGRRGRRAAPPRSPRCSRRCRRQSRGRRTSRAPAVLHSRPDGRDPRPVISVVAMIRPPPDRAAGRAPRRQPGRAAALRRPARTGSRDARRRAGTRPGWCGRHRRSPSASPTSARSSASSAPDRAAAHHGVLPLQPHHAAPIHDAQLRGLAPPRLPPRRRGRRTPRTRRSCPCWRCEPDVGRVRAASTAPPPPVGRRRRRHVRLRAPRRNSAVPTATARTRLRRASTSTCTSTVSASAPLRTAASSASSRTRSTSAGVGSTMLRSMVSRTIASATPMGEITSACRASRHGTPISAPVCGTSAAAPPPPPIRSTARWLQAVLLDQRSHLRHHLARTRRRAPRAPVSSPSCPIARAERSEAARAVRDRPWRSADSGTMPTALAAQVGVSAKRPAGVASTT